MLQIRKIFSISQLTLDIETKNNKFTNLQVDPFDNIYKEVSRKVQGDIIIVIKGKTCITKQTFYNLYEKYRQTHFKAQIYEFQELFQYFADLQKLVRDLSEQIYDDKTKTKIMNMQKEMAPQYENEPKLYENIQQEEVGTLTGLDLFLDCQKSKIKIKKICLFCQKEILDNTITPLCGHRYHDECFFHLTNFQIQQKQPIIRCICTINLNFNILSQLNIKGEVLKEQIFMVQLNQIRQKYKNLIKQCRSKFCYFFFIQNANLKLNFLCPICHQQYNDI